MYQNVLELKEYLAPYFNKRKSLKCAKVLAYFFKTFGRKDIENFGDFLIELMMRDEDFFNQKL